MILCVARRFGRISRLSTLRVIAGFCALSFAIGCNNGSQSTPSPASAAASSSNSQNAPAPAATTPQPSAQQSATKVAPPKPVEKPKKPFSEMTAMEVAQDPAAYGFKIGGEMNDGVMSGREAYNADLSMVYGINKQWLRTDPDGKVHVLTVHYDKSGKVLNARWGGF
jgi:hypothetical protein